MKITILTTGSRGDTQPYIALGVALQKAGCQTRIAAFENFAPLALSHGLDFQPIRGNVAEVAASDIAQEAMKADNPLKFLRSLNQLKKYTFSLQQDFWAAAEGADVIVYHPGAVIGYFLAQRLNIPAVLATPFPMTPTRAFPSLIFYDWPRLGGGFNRLTHQIFSQIMWLASRGPVKQFWREKYGRLPDKFGQPFSRQTSQSYPTIISGSDAVFARPDDWPEHVHNTGYWFLDEEPDWSPPTDLLNFLAAGPPPVYVGFGSVGDPDQAAATTRLVIAGLQQAGQRGLLATGWQGLSAGADLPADMFMLASAPHAWLFPRMAAVVHHGGAGTTAAGLRAGVPAVIIPHGNDQFAWGRRIYELGVGSEPIPRKRLTAEKLAAGLQAALAAETRQAADALGAIIRRENGAETAVKVILDSCNG